MNTRDISTATTTPAAQTLNQTNTASAVFAPIIKALIQCEEQVQGITSGWQPCNQVQEMFIQRFYSQKHELKAFSPDELKVWVRKTAQELNQILANHDYSIRLEPWPENEGLFGVAAIMDVLALWIEPGERTEMLCKSDNQRYPGVKLKQYAYKFSSNAHQHPLLAIQAQNGYEVWMTVADEPLSGLDLVCRVQDIRDGGLRLVDQDIHGSFPMINLSQEVDIEWLKGIRGTSNDTGQPVIITQALQETRFRMNEFGAHAQSAVAMGASRGIGPETVYVDRPFYLWILKDMGNDGPELKSIPVFAGYFDTDCWKDPGSIK